MWFKMCCALFQKVKNATSSTVRKIFVAIIGVTVLLFGFILIFTPGPAIIVIPLGLVILSTEFAWARFWIKSIKSHVSKYNSKLEKYFPKDDDKK